MSSTKEASSTPAPGYPNFAAGGKPFAAEPAPLGGERFCAAEQTVGRTLHASSDDRRRSEKSKVGRRQNSDNEKAEAHPQPKKNSTGETEK